MPDTTEPTPYETLMRSNILQRLKRRTVREAPERLNYGVIKSKQWEPRERARRLDLLPHRLYQRQIRRGIHF